MSTFQALRTCGRPAAAALLMLGALLAPAALSAQVADAALEVQASDESGQPMPGVAVTARSPETGYERTVTTDAAGLARINALQPGVYEVRAELSGFQPVKYTGITLRVGQSARIDAALKVAAVSEELTVTADVSPLVDIRKTDSSTNIVPEQIESLPVPDRDFQRLAFLAPGVQRERGGFRFIGGGPVIGAGGNASQSTILVDGVDFTDPVLGLARARFSQDAIREFRVITNRFDSEIGGSAGGALSIVTKSGTNELKGSAFGFFRDDALRSKKETETDKNPYSRKQYGFTLGGPIVKDRTHFFASVEQIDEDNVVLFRPGGAYASTASDPAVPVSQTLLFGGLDHRISNTQDLRAKVVYERYRQENFRVGSVVDPTAGMDLDRDNFNVTATHNWTIGGTSMNQLAVQIGRRKFEEPNNSTALSEFFSSGNTLQTGANITGDQKDTGNVFEARETFYARLGSGRWAADLKIGGAWQHVKDTWNFPVYPQDLMIYVTDTRAVPLVYVDAAGSGESTISTDLVSGFAQADFRPADNVTLNLGLRYDLDTNGNNPDYTSPLQETARGRDSNNFQPRAGFSWDITGRGTHVLRGGAGLFTGRFLLVPAHVELQQNSFTGRIIQQRLNGAVIGVPALALNPASPTTTGIALARDASRLDTSLVAPRSTQATLGYTLKLGHSGLYFDVEGVYVKGEDELVIRDTNWSGNATRTRPNRTLNQINTYTNAGHSKYKALVTSLRGTIKGHILTASYTLADKKNVNDDFSPALTDYPSDPADIEAEYGRSRADERHRFVASGVFRLPARFTVAPIFEYGSGQPWNRRRGYDFNGDGKNSDRLPGVGKFDQDGPSFASLNLRLTHKVPVGSRAEIEVIAEAFNLLNRTNWDVNTVINGEFLSGPTAANGALPAVQNPRYGQFTDTLQPREAQLGLRFSF